MKLSTEMFWALMFLLKDPSDLEKEHLKVYLRIRPFSSAEIESGESQVKIRNTWFRGNLLLSLKHPEMQTPM